MIEQSFSEVFASALDGVPTVVVGLGDGPQVLRVDRWSSQADADDHGLLALCDGPTLDIGCGPGRMTEALVARGHVALGIDVVGAAVTLTRERGVPALRLDVFDDVPGAGRWRTALLADGNIGIGGDPVRLLRRAGDLLAPGGRVVVELGAPGTAVVHSWAALQATDRRSRPFRWATLGVDDVARVAAAARLEVTQSGRIGARWAAVLSEASA